jgi:hypothetical protein
VVKDGLFIAKPEESDEFFAEKEVGKRASQHQKRRKKKVGGLIAPLPNHGD